MANQNSVESQFVDETKQVDNLTAPLIPVPEGAAAEGDDKSGEGKEGEDEGEVEESVKNRRHRRLERELKAERESSAFMAGRLQAITETEKFRAAADMGEHVKLVERIYGTNTPEAVEATNLLAQALKGVEERATTRAVELFRDEQKAQREAVRKEEEALDSIIEDLEDEHSISFTPAMEKSFFKLLEKMSPKDEEGNVVNYADPESVYEVFADKLVKPNTRAKDIASRSMTQGGSGGESKLQDDATMRALKEAGII
jgi:hypothetical protein